MKIDKMRVSLCWLAMMATAFLVGCPGDSGQTPDNGDPGDTTSNAQPGGEAPMTIEVSVVAREVPRKSGPRRSAGMKRRSS